MPFSTTLLNKLGVPIIHVGKFNYVWECLTTSKQISNSLFAEYNLHGKENKCQ